MARAIGHRGKPAVGVFEEQVEVAADGVARLPDEAGIAQASLQAGGRDAQHRALDHARVLDALHDVAVAFGLLLGDHAHQLQAVAHADEAAVLDDQEAVGQRLLARLHRQQRELLDGDVGLDDQRLLVHEGDAALLLEQLLVEGLGDLREEQRAVDQADRPAVLEHRQAAHLAMAAEDLVDLGVGVLGRDGHAGLRQIAGHGLRETGLSPAHGRGHLFNGGHGRGSC